MRINRFIATTTGMSRRAADTVIADGRVLVNGTPVSMGKEILENDRITLDGKHLTLQVTQTILFNKPVGYVTSRNGQGSKTIYDLLPANLHALKPVGRLDKDSSGLLLLTNDGNLAQQLTHPSFHKIKRYETRLDKPLQPLHRQMIQDIGMQLGDGPSKLILDRLKEGDDTQWQVTMHEGRNRQIRRTFEALGYTVKRLHRTQFDQWHLDTLQPGKFKTV